MSLADVPLVEKVGAFIIRRNRNGLYEFLLFLHEGMPEVPLQIPGGTVESRNEPVESALYRNIEEQSGLVGLPIIRKLGTLQWFWPEKQFWIKRHVFLLEASRNTPDTWTHAASGSNDEADLRFTFYWYLPEKGLRLGAGLDHFLTSEHLPELFPPEAATSALP